MKSYCDTLQNLLAQKGPKGIQNDQQAQEHLEGCMRCFEFLEALSEIDHQLHEAPFDQASDEVVEKVISKIREAGDNTGKLNPPKTLNKKSLIDRLRLFLIPMHKNSFKRLGYAVSVIIAIGALTALITPKFMGTYKLATLDQTVETDEYDREDQVFKTDQKPRASVRITKKKQKSQVVGLSQEFPPEPEKEEPSVDDKFEETVLETPAESIEEESAPAVASNEPRMIASKDKTGQSKLKKTEKEIFYRKKSSPDSGESNLSFYDLSSDERRQRVLKRESFPEIPEKRSAKLRDGEYDSYSKTLPEKIISKPDQDHLEKKLIPDFGYAVTRNGSMGAGGARPGKKPIQIGVGQKLLNQFIRERSAVENLSFQKASGYWANTYVPGDPAFRWLNTRLKNWDRTDLEKYVNTRVELDTAARQNSQPFDHPQNAALGVFLHTDRTGLNGKNRLLVQVGLQGTHRYSGSRSAMNVGIVLDLRGSRSHESKKKIKSLMQAFSKAKDIGDRFSLTIAGGPGGMLIEPKNFKYGYLTVTLENLFNQDTKKVKGLGLIPALKLAIQSVAQNDDPTSPLGSSEIILVTNQPLGELVSPVSNLAHQSALNGIPVSVVGIGDRVQIEEIDQIVLNGQGNRRLLDEAKEADKLVTRELSAASRVIARAVRLRIRLAPGVRLIDVKGSIRLDTTDSQKVRDAEKSIDLRLSRNLGIKSDRGEDEDGIQIVIPSFFAGDSHVILLDVLAPGPGHIADVTVKYKDLVKLKNGVVRSNLTLPRDQGRAGPLEKNVIKNLIAHNLYKTLVRAGEKFETGNDASAIRLTENYLSFLLAAQKNLSGFVRDTDMINDIQMLKGFLSVMKGAAVQNQNHRMYISDSLKLAGHLKVLPRPLNNH